MAGEAGKRKNVPVKIRIATDGKWFCVQFSYGGACFTAGRDDDTEEHARYYAEKLRKALASAGAFVVMEPGMFGEFTGQPIRAYGPTWEPSVPPRAAKRERG